MRRKRTIPQFLLCVTNEGYPAALEVRKIYQALRDPAAQKHKLVRVIDESGEDYLYPEHFFVPVELPSTVRKVFGQAS